MSDLERKRIAEDRAAQVAMNQRIEALERGIQRWRCLTATGFLTALGAFGLAVFGLSQLENTYFIGEVASALVGGAPNPSPVDVETDVSPGADETAKVVLSLAGDLPDIHPGSGVAPGETSQPALRGVQGEPSAAMDGGS